MAANSKKRLDPYEEGTDDDLGVLSSDGGAQIHMLSENPLSEEESLVEKKLRMMREQLKENYTSSGEFRDLKSQ